MNKKETWDSPFFEKKHQNLNQKKVLNVSSFLRPECVKLKEGKEGEKVSSYFLLFLLFIHFIACLVSQGDPILSVTNLAQFYSTFQAKVGRCRQQFQSEQHKMGQN